MVPIPSATETKGSHQGLTLIEVLVSVAILSTATAIIATIFMTALNAWQRGSKYLENLHHGEIIANQLVAALRSTAYFSSKPSLYGLRFTDGSDRYDADRVSWVCSGEAFLPPDSPLAGGLHRLELSIKYNEEGQPCLAAWAYPPLADEGELIREPWIVSDEVRGLNLRFYNPEDEIWEDDWEKTNTVPRLLEVTLYLDPVEEFGEPIKLQRLVEIPVAPPLGEQPAVAPAAAETAAGAGETGASGTAEGEPVTSETEGRTTIIRR